MRRRVGSARKYSSSLYQSALQSISRESRTGAVVGWRKRYSLHSLVEGSWCRRAIAHFLQRRNDAGVRRSRVWLLALDAHRTAPMLLTMAVESG